MLRIHKEILRSRRKIILIVLFSVATIFIILLAMSILRIERKSTSLPVTITHSTDTPSEQAPRADFQWKGGPDDPKFLTIDSVGLRGYVQRVGVDQHKEIAVPDNIHFAGWFVDTVKPGEVGLSIIDGHVDGPSQNAIFATLPDVQEGDTVVIQRGDDLKLFFKVFKIQSVSVKNAPSILFSKEPRVDSQLNLITCVGTFNEETNRYEERLIVSTELIQ